MFAKKPKIRQNQDCSEMRDNKENAKKIEPRKSPAREHPLDMTIKNGY